MLQVNALLEQELGKYLSRYYEPPRGALVTIEAVITAADLKTAKVLVSILPVAEGAAVVQTLTKLEHDIRHALMRHVVLKFFPALTFVHDMREEKAERIHRLLNHEASESSGEEKG